jgi:hypothetical protein
VEASGKVRRYGSARLTDDKSAQKHLLRTFGLDREVRVRWYVEGDTEYAVLNTALGSHPFIELINLRGQIVAGMAKGLSFRDNLRNDIRASVYSLISIDGDVEMYTRILRKAASAGEMFGEFYISKPDFELFNFSIPELVEVVCEIIGEEQAISDAERALLFAESQNATSNAHFFAAVRKVFPHHIRITKGDAWGRRLHEYIRRNRKMQLPGGGEQERPVVRAISAAVRSVTSNYKLSRERGKVDPDTGRIVYSR